MTSFWKTFSICTALACSSALYAQRGTEILLKSGKIEASQITPIEQVDLQQWKSNQNANSVYTILRFKSIPTIGQKNILLTRGVKLMDYLPNYAYIAAVPVGISTQDLRLAGVDAMIDILPKYKYSRYLATDNYPDYAFSKNGELNLFVLPYRDISKATLYSKLMSEGFEVSETKTSKTGLNLTVSLDDIERLAAISIVRFIDLAEAPAIPDGRKGRSLHRANALSKAPGTGYDGTGVVLGLADDGGVNHIDFQGRLTDHTADQGGTHGDMCLGLAGGAGNMETAGVGMATGSYLHLYDIGGYPHVVDAINNFNTLGTTITSTSYSQGCGGVYDGTAENIDSDVFTLNNLLNVFSAGNSSSNTCSSVYGSIIAPDGRYYGNITGGRKAAKNTLAVANLEYQDIRTASSSRGPCEDGRLKPDIAANGTGNYATDPNNTYAPGGGTSAACPSVAGVSAMLYQAYKENNTGQLPNSGLMKGIMLNTADDLGRPGPDFDFGWGRINARKAVKAIENKTYFTGNLANGNSTTFTVNVPANAKELKVMLYWLDSAGASTAGKALVSDLDLQVQDPNGTNYLPWILNTAAHIDSLQKDAVRGVDSVNNMEQVTFNAPTPGAYTVNIDGTLLPLGAQEFFVVYYIEMDEVFVTYPIGSESFVPSETEVLRWDAVGNTTDFTLEYSIDRGASWNNIATVPADLRYYDWTVPSDLTNEALVRVTRGSATATAVDTFNIMNLPSNLTVTKLAQNSATLSWTGASGANKYEVYQLGAKYMEIIGSSATNSFVINGLIEDSVYYFSVRALDTTRHIIGRRADAIEYAHYSDGECNDCVAQISTFPYQQSFENTFGNWCQSLKDDINWDLNTGGTPSNGTGPSSSNDGNYYVFIESSSPNYPAKVAKLVSPCFDITSLTTPTLTFDYSMYGADMGTLYVERSYDGGITWDTLYQVGGNQGAGWNTQKIDLTNLSDTLMFRFSGETGIDYTSDIAIDHVRIGEEPAMPAISCTGVLIPSFMEGFENPLSTIAQSIQDDIDWTKQSGATPSNNTGPTAAFEGNNYLFVEASNPNNPGKIAIFDTRCYDLSTAVSPEISFAYHMFGADMGELKVYVRGNSTYKGNWQLLFNKSGDQGNAWDSVAYNLAPFIGDTVVFRFEGTTGTGYMSDIAVDAINVSDSPITGQSTLAKTATKIEVYPNPTKEDLYIQFDSKEMNDYTISVVNTLGQELRVITLNDVIGEVQEVFNLNDLPNGSYFVRVQSTTETKVLPFSVVK